MRGMKGITVWIWMIAGVIVGLILFTVYVQLLGITTTTREIQIAETSFDDLANTANSYCGAFGVARITKLFTFPDIVTRIYSTDEAKSYVPVNGRTYGTTICMNATKEFDCQSIACRIEMSNINSTNRLTGILNTLTGGFQNNDFQLDVEKTDCGVSVINAGESPAICP